MLEEFASCYEIKTGNTFDTKRRHIRYVRRFLLWQHTDFPIASSRCLAHIINLATQAVIATRSKAKYYNGNPADDLLPENLGTDERDEIGIVRAICIKVRTCHCLPWHAN